MSTTHRLSLSVRGYIAGSDHDLKKLFKHPDGSWYTPREAREALMEQLSKGIEALPVGGPCEGFDYRGGGCPGHEGAA